MRLLTALMIALATVPIAHAQSEHPPVPAYASAARVRVQYLRLHSNTTGQRADVVLQEASMTVPDDTIAERTGKLPDGGTLKTAISLHHNKDNTIEVLLTSRFDVPNALTTLTVTRRVALDKTTHLSAIEYNGEMIEIDMRVSKSEDIKVYPMSHSTPPIIQSPL